MVYYDLKSILLGIPITFLFGVFSSLFILSERILITGIPFCVRQALKTKTGQRLGEFLKLSTELDFSSPLSTFVGVITFFILFIILSYILLFGQIRIYLFLVMLLGFYIAHRFLGKYFESAIRIVFSCLIFWMLKIVFVFCKIVLFIMKKLKITRKAEKTIDKKAEIL